MLNNIVHEIYGNIFTNNFTRNSSGHKLPQPQHINSHPPYGGQMARQKKKKSNGRIIRIQEEPRELHQNRKNCVTLIPRNIAQEDYIANLHDANQRIVIATGPAGTGKTYLACLKAIELLKNQEVSTIIVTRPAVCADEKIGFLPGSLEQKMDPFLAPMFDVFEEYYSPKEVKMMIDEKIIQVVPLAFMRGRNFRNAFILADEMQNSTPNQLKMLLTRISEGSRSVVTGDVTQHDRGIDKNGMQDFCDKFISSSSIAITKFSNDDIERDPIVSEILDIYGEC